MNSTYLDCPVTKVKVKDALPEIETNCLLSAICHNSEDATDISEIVVIELQNRVGQYIEVLMQANLDTLV